MFSFMFRNTKIENDLIFDEEISKRMTEMAWLCPEDGRGGQMSDKGSCERMKVQCEMIDGPVSLAAVPVPVPVSLLPGFQQGQILKKSD